MVNHEIVQLPALTDRRELRCPTPYYLHSQFLAWHKEFTRRSSNMVRMISQIVSDLPIRRTGAEEVAGSHWAPGANSNTSPMHRKSRPARCHQPGRRQEGRQKARHKP